MPIYEYKCASCGHEFEKLQPISAGFRQSCPQCGASAERRISLGSFVLKGGGWYVTEHPSKARRKAQKAEKPAPEKSSEACPVQAS